MMAEVGERLGLPSALDAFAHLAVDAGRPDRAVRLAGAAARLRASSGTSEWPAVQQSRERWLAVAREALSPETFAAAWAAGQAMTPEEAIGYAADSACTG